MFSPLLLEPWCVHLSFAALSLLCFARSNQRSQDSRFAGHRSAAPPSKPCSRAGSATSRKEAPARDAARGDLQAGCRAGSLHTAACQARRAAGADSACHCQSSRKQPPVKRQSVISPRSPRAYFDEHGALPDGWEAAVHRRSLQPCAHKWPAWVRATEPQGPKQQATSPKNYRHGTEEEHQDRNDEREHCEDGHAISAHFAKAGQAAQQAAAPGRQSAEEAAMEQALRESAAEHQANTDPAEAATQQQPADTASEASDVRSELAAFQEQMAKMMALFQQQQQTKAASKATEPQPATKPAGKASAPAFLEPDQSQQPPHKSSPRSTTSPLSPQQTKRRSTGWSSTAISSGTTCKEPASMT